MARERLTKRGLPGKDSPEPFYYVLGSGRHDGAVRPPGRTGLVNWCLLGDTGRLVAWLLDPFSLVGVEISSHTLVEETSVFQYSIKGSLVLELVNNSL